VKHKLRHLEEKGIVCSVAPCEPRVHSIVRPEVGSINDCSCTKRQWLVVAIIANRTHGVVLTNSNNRTIFLCVDIVKEGLTFPTKKCVMGGK
jgi:hypothetical protein